MTVGKLKELLKDVPETVEIENLECMLITKIYNSVADDIVSIRLEIG